MKTEKLWSILTSTNEWIRFSDTKAGVLLTVYGVILTIVYSNADNVYTAILNNEVLVYLTIVLVLLALVSMIFSFMTLNPKLKNDNPTSTIYFGHIKEKYVDYLDYYNDIDNKLESDEFDKQIAEQIYVNSKIAWSKFKYVSWAIRLFSISVMLLLVCLVMYLV